MVHRAQNKSVLNTAHVKIALDSPSFGLYLSDIHSCNEYYV